MLDQIINLRTTNENFPKLQSKPPITVSLLEQQVRQSNNKERPNKHKNILGKTPIEPEKNASDAAA